MANSSTYDDIVNKWSAFYNVPAALIKAIIMQESTFNPRAVNRSDPHGGSFGLMQMSLPTASDVARWFGISWGGSNELVNDPDKNVQMGTAYLRHQLDRYHGDTRAAVSAYNHGSAYSGNQSYVDSVMRYFSQFGGDPNTGIVSPPGSGVQGSSGSGFSFSNVEMAFLASAAVVAFLFMRRIL